MKTSLYRQAALQNLTVSERLDTAVQVVSPATSLVVLAAFVAIGVALVWAFIGRVPSRVYGEGLLLRQGSIVDVTSVADGQVERLAVAVGDAVKENDVIAYIDQPELKKQAALLQLKLGELTFKDTQLERLDEQGRGLKSAAFHQQRASVTFATKELKKQLAFYEQKLKSDTTLESQGLAIPAAVAETRQKVLDLHDAINGKHAEEHDIAFKVLDTTRTLAGRRYDLAMELNETRRTLEEVQKRIDTQSVVLAKAAGRIIEVKLADGDVVTRGRPIATLEATPEGAPDLLAVVYIPAKDGKRVKVGMPIKLAPAVVKPEEDGYLLGDVESVSPFPASEQSILRTVRNESVVTSLLKDGPVYEARVRVRANRSTPSGLAWSNNHGPALQIASGTPVHGLVTVRTRRPVELIVPAVARFLSDAPPQE